MKGEPKFGLDQIGELFVKEKEIATREDECVTNDGLAFWMDDETPAVRVTGNRGYNGVLALTDKGWKEVIQFRIRSKR